MTKPSFLLVITGEAQKKINKRLVGKPVSRDDGSRPGSEPLDGLGQTEEGSAEGFGRLGNTLCKPL